MTDLDIFLDQLHAEKYRAPGETFEDSCARVADAVKDSDAHFRAIYEITRNRRFVFGGRVQSAMGATRAVTPFNCVGSENIEDSMEGIMRAATRAAAVMRQGGGIGYNFGTLRPRGDNIKTLDSHSSGPVSFMRIFDAVCETIASAGQRRGAQMAVKPVNHPDIQEFVRAKRDNKSLTNFNMSVFITDQFMMAVEADAMFPLEFGGRVYKEISAKALWNDIMRSNWEYAEPGVLFYDTIQRENNLSYCEEITVTNPCAEQPLPPNGACLLGSVNLTQYVVENGLDYPRMIADLEAVVTALDNVIDRAEYPLPELKQEALDKRRMGIGVMGLANAIEAKGHPYGSTGFCDMAEKAMQAITNAAYQASARLASRKGTFPLYDKAGYMASPFIQRLWPETRDMIAKYGVRNSHLTSIAPNGTIGLISGAVSGGLEPVFSAAYTRPFRTGGEKHRMVEIKDYGLRTFGTVPRTADECTVDDHLNVLLALQPHVDSACSKTINVGDHVTWEEFKEIYMKAWRGGAKGCTIFRAAGKRTALFTKACTIDAESGERSCE